MALKTLTVYQIYFDNNSKNNCYKESLLYDNTNKLTPFFENSPILDLVKQKKHKDSEYFAVFSHDIRQEVIFKENKLPFNITNLEKVIKDNPFDIYSFQKRRQNKNIVIQAERYHKNFINYMDYILTEIGYSIPKQLDKIVLFNHFVAKSDIYESYVYEMLEPAMRVMNTMPELHKNANYKKRNSPDFTKQLGYNHYPYHPFICERLMSVWLHYNPQYTFKHIF